MARKLTMTFKELIGKLRTDTFVSIIDSCADQGKKGIVFEALWHIVAKFNCIPNIVIDSHIKSNPNEHLFTLEDFNKDFICKKINGGASGFSDITFRSGDHLYISSSKLFDDDSTKVLDDWDLTNLSTLKLKYQSEKIRCIIFTKSKEQFKLKYDRATTNHLYEIDAVYDLNDLEKSIVSVKEILSKYDYNFERLDTCYFGKVKKSIKLFYHQELCIEKTLRMDRKLPILWGLKCRSGKSYIMAGYILAKSFNCTLVITPIPNESISALIKMFEEIIEFDNYDVIHYQKDKKITSSGKPMIIIASKQILQNKVVEELNKVHFNAIFWDESHHGGTTVLSKDIISTYKKSDTELILLTATYEKPRSEWNIPDSQMFIWELEDERFCKEKNVYELTKKFGEKCLESHDIQEEYRYMPNLSYLGLKHTAKFVSEFKHLNQDDSYSFDVSELLRVTDGRFNNEMEVKHLLNYYFGNGTQFHGILKQLKTKQTRTPFTHLWFLPCTSGGLMECSEQMKKCIEEQKFGRNYSVEILNSKHNKSDKDLEKYIFDLETSAKGNGKDGLIILLGVMCSMGVSLPRADLVFLLNNVESMDQIRQMLMRSMTEDKKNKNYGFVIDLNQKRVLKSILYSSRYHGSVRSTIERALNVIDICDDDMEFSDKTELFMDIWNKSNFNKLDLVASRLASIGSIEIKDVDLKKIKSYMKTVGKTTSKTLREEVQVNTEDVIPDARSESGSDSVEDKTEVEIDYGKELVTSIPYLAGLLTHSTKENDIISILLSLNADPHIRSIFLTQCTTWWGIQNTDGFIDLLIYLVKEYYSNEKRTQINSSIEILKEQMTCLLDDKKSLLIMINSMLKPKAVEKEKNGEVFTPLELVEEMMNKLPTDVWSNPKLKWFDPTVGIGNFMVCVYYRLMDGLESVIPDYYERKTHIIENMLYMSEMNIKNVFICKTVFGDNANIHEGDTLKLDVGKWSIEKFDIIIGNPPYNSGGIRSSTGAKLGEKNETIWPKFVEQAFAILKDGGYLAFIHPLSWLKTSHSQHDTLLNKHIVWLMLWDDGKSKSTISADIPLSIYVLHNIENTKNMTEVNSTMKRQNLTTTDKLYLNPKYSIPLAYHSIFAKIAQKIEDNPELKLKINTTTVKSEGNAFKMPLNVSEDDMLAVDTYRVKDGYFVKKMKEKHPDTKTRKLIIANKSGFAGCMIDEGNLGMTGNHKFYIVGDNLERLLELFKTKLSSLVCNNTRYGQHFLDKGAFDYIIDVRKVSTKDLPEITDECLYKYLELTKEEIEML
jgi:superfamily II DNA or RNA helicase